MKRAISLLQTRSFIPLNDEEVVSFCKDFQKPPDGSLRPYLVRGVAFGGTPTYTVVRFDRATGQLIVYHATYDGENLLTAYAVRNAEPIALVVFLSRPPSAVYPTAAVGGDGVLGGAGQETDWR